MFVRDASLNFIEADEADVLEIHRSTEAVAVAPDDRAPRLFEAFVCTVRRDDLSWVYFALQAVDKKEVHIYTRHGKPEVGDSSAKLLREALDFAGSLGFRMQVVNLKYSKALREVVIRDIHVIRRPAGTKVMDGAAIRKMAAEQAESQKVVGAKGGDVVAPQAASEAPGDKPGLADEADVAPTLGQRESGSPSGEKVASAKSEAAVMERMKAEADRLAAEKDAARKLADERLALLKSDIERLTAEKKEAESAAASETARLKAEVDQLNTETQAARKMMDEGLAPLKAEIDELAKEKDRLDKTLESERSTLKSEIAKLAKEKETAEKGALSELGRLRAERDRFLTEKNMAEKAVAAEPDALKTEIAGILSGIESLRKSAAEEASRLRDEARKLGDEKIAVEKKLTVELAELGATNERLLAEKEAVRKLAKERLALLMAEAELLSAEKGAVEGLAAGRAGLETAERQRMAREKAEAELEALRSEIERLAAAKAASEKSARAEVAALKAELERALTGGASRASIAVGGTNQPQIKDKHAGGEPVGKSIPIAGNDREMHSEGAPSQHDMLAPQEAEWDEEQELPADGSFVGGDGSDPFSFMGTGVGDASSFSAEYSGHSGPPVAFRLDKSLKCIDYDAPEDILELYHSLNMVNITPDGHTPQTCSAYICALKKGADRLVYVAWLVSGGKKTFIYAPERQPENDAGCTEILRSATEFVETVGFIMDSVRLGADREKRVRALGKIPVICQRQKIG